MTVEKFGNIVKPNLVIHWECESEQRTALVLAAEAQTTLGAVVELLVERWDLPVWQDEPVAYDLYTLVEKQTLGIPAHIHRRLKNILSKCGPFDSEITLDAVFVDNRIAAWRKRLPHAPSPAARVDVVVGFLCDQYSNKGENALGLFLHVLSEQVSTGDVCHSQLIELANELKRVIGADKKTLDLSQTLESSRGFTHLYLVAVTGHLVIAQSPADITVFSVRHPDTETKVSILVLLGAITAGEVSSKLVEFWRLREEVLVFYALQFPGGRALPSDKRLARLGVSDESQLTLTRQEGFEVITSAAEQGSPGITQDTDIETPRLEGGALRKLVQAFNQSLSDEELLALMKQFVPEKEFRGNEKEYLAFLRQMMTAMDSMDDEDLQMMEELARQGDYWGDGQLTDEETALTDEEEEIIEIIVAPEPSPSAGKPTVAPSTLAEPGGIREEISEKDFRKHLLEAMYGGLDGADFDELLFHLDVDKGEFEGNKKGRIIGLIQYYRKRNELPELLSELFDMAPHVKKTLVDRGCQDWFPK